MDRKLIQYLPYAVRDFAEYRGITTGEQPEFELAWDAHKEVFINQFVDTALDYGLSRWEKMLEITPKATDTLELRRARIKARLMVNTPYTIRWLRNWLDEICGIGNHVENMTDYTLDLQLDYEKIPDARRLPIEIKGILEAILPENITLVSRFWLESQTHAIAGGGLVGIRREDRAVIRVPPLKKPGGAAKRTVSAGALGSYQRVRVPVRNPFMIRR